MTAYKKAENDAQRIKEADISKCNSCNKGRSHAGSNKCAPSSIHDDDGGGAPMDDMPPTNKCTSDSLNEPMKEGTVKYIDNVTLIEQAHAINKQVSSLQAAAASSKLGNMRVCYIVAGKSEGYFCRAPFFEIISLVSPAYSFECTS